jgi:hypothetical protein
MKYLTAGNVHVFFKKYENENVALLQLTEKRNNLLNIIKSLDEKNIDLFCVVTEDGFDIVKSYIASIMNNILKNRSFSTHPSYDVFLPNNMLTRDPMNVPVVLTESDTWTQEKTICILPGWDFYGLEWIIRRWDSMLCSFDNDNFFVKPSYPKDIYNNLVPPNLVLSTLKMFEKVYGKDKLTRDYYALSLFSNDLGKRILIFFYEYETEKWTRQILYQKLKTLYHSTNSKNPFRMCIFYQSNAGMIVIKKKEFSISMFINQYFSFSGMFVCQKFFEENSMNIGLTLRSTMPYLYSFCMQQRMSIINTLRAEIGRLHKNHSYGWINKDVASQQNTPFWNLISDQWDHINRNIYLWHGKSLIYQDSQMKIGCPVLGLFNPTQIANFEKYP